MHTSDLYEYALPFGALLLGTLAFVLTKLESRSFDRRHVKDASDPVDQHRASE